MKGEKVKITIGAPTYNSVERLQNLLTSIEFYTDFDKNDYKIVILDDGTKDLNKRKELAAVALRCGVDFIQHEKNEGIPASWNNLSRHYSSDFVVLFNDDIQVCDANWLKCAIFALEQNEKVASVGFPLIQIDPFTGLLNKNYSLPDPNAKIGKVGACVGCSFVFKRKIFDEIGGFDAESLISFYEETDFGFRLAEKGFYSAMLSYPAVSHYGSQTFAQNFELCIQKPKDNILSMQEYKEIMLKKYPLERIEPIPGFVYRMEYSRVIFAKKFNCSDFWDCPQVEVHRRLVDTLPKLSVRYLNKDLEEVECEI